MRDRMVGVAPRSCLRAGSLAAVTRGVRQSEGATMGARVPYARNVEEVRA